MGCGIIHGNARNELISSEKALTNKKIHNREGGVLLAKSEQARGRRVGFTSGVFDLVHRGHVQIEAAREACDFLIVGINSDRSVRQNKGAISGC